MKRANICGLGEKTRLNFSQTRNNVKFFEEVRFNYVDIYSINAYNVIVSVYNMFLFVRGYK